jgi:ammonium transporter Rh
MIMLLIGFGFLMTFLRRYSFTAVGMNFFLTCFAMLEAVLAVGAVEQVGCVEEAGAEHKHTCLLMHA